MVHRDEGHALLDKSVAMGIYTLRHEIGDKIWAKLIMVGQFTMRLLGVVFWLFVSFFFFWGGAVGEEEWRGAFSYIILFKRDDAACNEHFMLL